MSKIIRYLHRAALLPDGAGKADGQLLECFIAQKDEAAFEALVRRHGPMVFGVCRRVLRNSHDAEDAFQATFLVLVRKAAAIVPRDNVANWLYGVACRTAQKAQALNAKNRAREMHMPMPPESQTSEQERWRDLKPILDQELSRLPDKYRSPIVLCALEGKSHKEAARQLGWPQGTLSVRLARAKALLARRLARHGLAPSAGALATGLADNAASAGVPPGLVVSTVKAATLYAAAQGASAGAVSAQVAALTKGVLWSMFLTKVRIVIRMVSLVCVLAASAVVCRQVLRAQPDEAKQPEAALTHEKAKPKKDQGPGAAQNLAKKYQLTGSVRVEKSGEPVPGAIIEVLTGDSGTVVPRTAAETGKDGRFTLDLEPGHVEVWQLRPPAGYWTPRTMIQESLVLSAAEPVRYKEYIVRRGTAWNFSLLRKAPVRGSVVSARDRNGFFFTLVDDAGGARLTLPSEAGKVTVNVPDKSIALEWEADFRTDNVKSVAPEEDAPGSFTLTDGAGRKATVSAPGLVQPVLDGGKLVIRVRMAEPDPRALGELTGQVVDTAGRPVAGAQVVLGFVDPEHHSGAQSSEEEHRVLTDAQGKYRIKSIPRPARGGPGVHVQLTVTKEGFAGKDTRDFRFEPSGDMPQVAPVVTVEVGNTVRGTVVDTEGRPAIGAWVRVDGSYANRNQFTKTDDCGKFTVRNLRQGIAQITFNYGKLWANGNFVAERDPEWVTVKLKPLPQPPLPAAVPAPTQAVTPKHLAVGTPAPEWQTGPWSDGRTRNVADYKGKVVFLDFWGTWCRPCIAALPMLENLKAKYQRRGVVFVSVHTPREAEATVRRLLNVKKVSLVFAFDQDRQKDDNNKSGKTAERYGVGGCPTYVLIDRAGKIAFHSEDPGVMAVAEAIAKELGLDPNSEDCTEEACQVLERVLERSIQKVLAEK